MRPRTKKELRKYVAALEFQIESLRIVSVYQKADINRKNRDEISKQYQLMYEYRLDELQKELNAEKPYAFYYKKLIQIINEVPALQSEWEKFMVYIKLSCDENDLIALGN